MKPFAYLEPRTIQEAASLKRENPSSVYLAGGTDVLPLMKYDLIFPQTLISLELVPGLGEITIAGRDLLIGGRVRLHQLHRFAAERPALAGLSRAAQLVASPQIRRLGTVAGNLRQSRRCFYYNQSGQWRQGLATCFKNQGEVCHQAPASPSCRALHYSDLAPALLAAGAHALVFSGETVMEGPCCSDQAEALNHHGQPGGLETRPLESLWAEPSPLPDEALVSHIVLPEFQELRRLFFRKRAVRAAIDFPLANAALAWRDGGRVRLTVGAMAPEAFPLEETAAEISRHLQAGRPLPENLEALAEQEARRKMSPIREATVSPAVKIKALTAVLREVLYDLRCGLE